MLRVKDLDRALHFFIDQLGLVEVKRSEHPAGKFTLIFLATAKGDPEIELTYNWDMTDEYTMGRNFGHIAFEVDDIYATCTRLLENGVIINRPPRDGYMAFIKSPDNQSVELLQRGTPLITKLPWSEMKNIGTW
jgi:lactoylglutathione lyase